jgi:hypothetical protein
MKNIVSYKHFENLNDNINIDNMSEEDKINFIEENIDKVDNQDGLISDSILSKVKNGLTKTLASATIIGLAAMILQSCATYKYPSNDRIGCKFKSSNSFIRFGAPKKRG